MLRITGFQDYRAPDAALAAGDLGTNSHPQAIFDQQVRDHTCPLVGVGRMLVFPARH